MIQPDRLLCASIANIPEVATAFAEVRLVAPDSVEFTRTSMPDAYRLIRVLYRFINPD